MSHYLWPDWYFENITKIPPGFFKKHRIRYLICDIDNTLVSYADPLPTPVVLAFFEQLREEGVRLAFASNNNKQRVNTFAADTGIPAVHGAAKPFPKGVQAAMMLMGANKEECAMLGDQLLTDCFAAKNVGVKMILVNPISYDRSGLFFRVKRALEGPILRSYLRTHEINDPSPGKKRRKRRKKR